MLKSPVIAVFLAAAAVAVAGVAVWFFSQGPNEVIFQQPESAEEENDNELGLRFLILRDRTVEETEISEETEAERIVRPGRGLEPAAAQALRLSEAELTRVNELLLATMERIRQRELRQSNVREVSADRIVFYIKGSADAAQSIKSDLRWALEGELGEERTETLFALGDRQLVRDLQYFGETDQQVIFELKQIENEEVKHEASFRRLGAYGIYETRAPIGSAPGDRWLQHTPGEYEHFLFLIPPPGR